MDISMDLSMDLSMDIHIHGNPDYLTDSFIGQGRTYNFLWKFRASMRHTRDDTRGTPSVLPIH